MPVWTDKNTHKELDSADENVDGGQAGGSFSGSGPAGRDGQAQISCPRTWVRSVRMIPLRRILDCELKYEWRQ